MDLTSTFMATIAQVSFAATGLVLVALAADPASRNYWYGRHSHVVLANMHFLMLLAPGLVSLGALVQYKPGSSAWPIAAAVIGLLLAYIVLVMGQALRGTRQLEEFQKLDNDVIKANDFFRLLAVGYASASIIGLGGDLGLVILQALMIANLLGGALSVPVLLRQYEIVHVAPVANQAQQASAPPAQQSTSDDTGVGAGCLAMGALIILGIFGILREKK